MSNSSSVSISTSDFCFSNIGCVSSRSIQQLYWEAFTASYKDDIECAIPKFKKISDHKFSTEYDSMGPYCKHQIAISEAYLSVYNKIKDTTVLEEVVIEKLCAAELTPGTIEDEFVFVLDASASINSVEFNKMKQTIGMILAEYDTSGIDVSYAVIQFSGSSEQEVSIALTSDLDDINYLTRAYSGQTDVTAGVTYAENYISSAAPTARMLLFTDALKSQASGLVSYGNTIKDFPSNRDVTVVRYQIGSSGDSESNSYFAAFSSKGGNYQGDVDNNSGDPQGEGPPRKFVIGDFAGTFASVVDSVLDFTSCDYLVVTRNTFCDTAVVNWFALDSGLIASDSTDISYIKTNGIGSFRVEINCQGGCGFLQEYTFDDPSGLETESINNSNQNIETLLKSISSRDIIRPNGSLETPLSRELELLNGEVDNDNPISLKPNPTVGLLYISGVAPNTKYSVFSQQGKELLHGQISESKSINVGDLPAGLYFLNVESDQYNNSLKFIKVK